MKYRANASEPFQELYIKALDSMPIGSIIGFAGSDIPNGWLICDGSTLDEETYPELYDALGGSGSTFTLPDYQSRVPVGYDANDTDFNAIGKTGGSKELQKHSHSVVHSAETINVQAGSSATCVKNYPYTTTGETGTGNSGNLQPYIVQYFIIKAKNTTPTMASIVNTTNDSTTDGYSCYYLNWKLAGTTTSNGFIAIPSDAKELHIMTRENDQMYTKNLMVNDLVNGDYLYDGFYVSSTNYGVCAWKYTSSSGIQCLSLQRQGSSKLGDSTTKIYYK